MNETKAAELAEKLAAQLKERFGATVPTSQAAAMLRDYAALLRDSEGPAVTTDNQSTRAGDGGHAPFGWALVCNNGTTADFRPRVNDFFGAIQEHEAFTAEDVGRRDAEWAGMAPHRIVALYGSASGPAESPCQFAIDGGGNLYRRYREPVCAGCVPAKKLTDKWESARVADFNSGWNACREALLTAAPHPPAQQAEPVRWEFRWTNPDDDPSRHAESLVWKGVVPSWNQTMEMACAELLRYRWNDRPCYEVRALGVISPPPHKAEGASHE